MKLGLCEAHWDRRGEEVAAHRLGLCQPCWRGAALAENEHARPLAESAGRLRGAITLAALAAAKVNDGKEGG